MTEKRFTLDDESDIIEFDWNTNEFVDEFRWGDGKSWDNVCNRLNELHDENQQLRKFIMDLQNMIQFDVDNGIKTYPKTLSEYLANALKVVMNDY